MGPVIYQFHDIGGSQGLDNTRILLKFLPRPLASNAYGGGPRYSDISWPMTDINVARPVYLC